MNFGKNIQSTVFKISYHFKQKLVNVGIAAPSCIHFRSPYPMGSLVVDCCNRLVASPGACVAQAAHSIGCLDVFGSYYSDCLGTLGSYDIDYLEELGNHCEVDTDIQADKKCLAHYCHILDNLGTRNRCKVDTDP